MSIQNRTNIARTPSTQDVGKTQSQQSQEKQASFNDVMAGLREITKTGISFSPQAQSTEIKKYKALRESAKGLSLDATQSADLDIASMMALSNIGPMAFKLTAERLVSRVDAHNTNHVMRKPTQDLERFNVAKSWDADSTPPALAASSRILGKLAPNSGARTPQIEASVAMASLMHDVGYYYGGSRDDKVTADKVFGDQIPYFASKLDSKAGAAAKGDTALQFAQKHELPGAVFLQ